MTASQIHSIAWRAVGRDPVALRQSVSRAGFTRAPPWGSFAAMRPTALILLLPATAACGDEATRGRALAETVAAEVREDCEGASAPDEAMRRHLLRLCACTEARISATPMRFGESDKSIGAKVRAATEACLADLGGAPGEGRR